MFNIQQIMEYRYNIYILMVIFCILLIISVILIDNSKKRNEKLVKYNEDTINNLKYIYDRFMKL